MKSIIYLDHQATTPVDEEVLAAMLPFFREDFANPASTDHAMGSTAHTAVERARENLARLLDARPEEIIFTSGATESNNIALRGILAGKPDGEIITSQIEHKAVLECCRALERAGTPVTYLPVNRDGLVSPDQLEAAISGKTRLVSVMAANNETGAIQPLAHLARIAHAAGALFHTDAAQAAGHVPVLPAQDGLDLVSLSGHKMYGPKGVGALYIRRRPAIQIQPLTWGGGQERGIRPGTVNVPAVVGMGEAGLVARRDMVTTAARIERLRNHLWNLLSTKINDLELIGPPFGVSRLPGNLLVAVPGVSARAVVKLVGRELAISTGSACQTDVVEPSHVLVAMGRGDEAKFTLRFGVGRSTSEAEVETAADLVATAVRRAQLVH